MDRWIRTGMDMEAVMRTKLMGCAGSLILSAGACQPICLGQAVTGTLLGTVLDSYWSCCAECKRDHHE